MTELGAAPVIRYTIYPNLEWKICHNCGDQFLASHKHYRPMFKIVPVFNAAPKTVHFCSEACLQSVPKGTTAPCGCDYRKLILSPGKGGDKFVCLEHMVVARPELNKEPG